VGADRAAEPNRIGRPRKTDLREVVNALLYMASSGGAWRLLPKDLPPFSTVQKYFYRWRDPWPAACHQQ
jgi:transposase